MIEKGSPAEAGRLLENETLEAAIAKARAVVLLEWTGTQPSQVADREILHAQYKAFDRIKTALRSIRDRDLDPNSRE